MEMTEARSYLPIALASYKPGEPALVKLGCTCSGQTLYGRHWIRLDCPLHWFTPQRRREWEQHLETCSRCRRHLGLPRRRWRDPLTDDD